MKTFKEYTLFEIDQLISAHKMLNPNFVEPSAEIMQDIITETERRMSNDDDPSFTLDNLFGIRCYNSACGCVGAHEGYNFCPCEISSYMEHYRFHLMRHFKLLEA